LHPVFSSADIKKSLAQFAKMFKQVDNRWKNNVLLTRKKSNIFEFTNNNQIKDNMNEDIIILDKVQKNLEN